MGNCGLSFDNYHFLEEKLIRMDMDAEGDKPAYSRIMDIQIERDLLTLTSLEHQSSLKFTRVQHRKPQNAETPCPASPM
jgi:hypothetical protein